MIGAFAEWERNVIRKRQAEGIEKAKAKGVYERRGKRISRKRIVDMTNDGSSVTDIANEMGISRMSVYRILKEAA